MSKIYPSEFSQIPLGDLENMNTDREPDYPVMIRGQAFKTSAGEWFYGDGRSRSDDAALMRVSAIGVTVNTSPLSADSSAVSAKQENASNLRISAFSNDANLFRVSAIGDIEVHNQANAADFRASCFSDAANLFRVSVIQDDAYNVNVSAKSNDGGTFRTSSFLADNPTITGFIGRVSSVGTISVSSHEVKQSDAASLMVSTRFTDDATINKFFGRMSAISEGANLMRVSVITGSLVSATMKEGTSMIGSVSAILRDNTTITNYIGRVSAIQAAAQNCMVSAKNNLAAEFLVSAFSTDATSFRVSADLYADTVGSLTAFRSLSLSASQAIKATAGAIYGYYLWNTTTVPQYVKFTNTSGAINVGTDTPIFMAMIPASAAANMEFTHGIKGFTAGIGVHASSAVADNATTPAAASAVGGTIFYA